MWLFAATICRRNCTSTELLVQILKLFGHCVHAKLLALHTTCTSHIYYTTPLSVLVFNCLHNLAPSYLSTMCQLVADNAGRHRLRSAARGVLAVPATRMLLYGPRNFAVAGPSTWHSLPAPLRSCRLTSMFRRDLKTELFIRTYH